MCVYIYIYIYIIGGSHGATGPAGPSAGTAVPCRRLPKTSAIQGSVKFKVVKLC